MLQIFEVKMNRFILTDVKGCVHTPVLGQCWLNLFMIFKNSVTSKKQEQFLTQCKNLKQGLCHLSNVVHAYCGQHRDSMIVRWGEKDRDQIFKIEAGEDRNCRQGEINSLAVAQPHFLSLTQM